MDTKNFLELMREWYRETDDTHRKKCLHGAAQILKDEFPAASTAQDVEREWKLLFKEKSKSLGDAVLAGKIHRRRVGNIMQAMTEAREKIAASAKWERDNERKMERV